ncbi:MAG: DUF1232 domain-containing protein [Chloroflexi bacterium]|uniref:YkvA family protein n=1 Tax=Candidatus Flexifilum breve TaxID=3140694 RepID=UPI00313665CF|nr:DUF1232 domain-containing protein [Chloroflexota bacterium]
MTENATVPADPGMGIEPLKEAEIHGRAPDWYDQWRDRIREWVSRGADDQVAQIVLLVPDMLMLVVRLARDKRVPFLLKAQLLLAAAYVISPVDLVPEAILGVIGLAEDAGALALVLMWISGIGNVDKQVLRDNWSGSGDVEQAITGLHKRVTDNADKLFTPETWAKIRARFERGTPDVVEGKAKRRLPRLSLRRKKPAEEEVL